MIAMRALGDPDAFPVTDLGVRRATDDLGVASSATALSRRADRWRPWRAYATQYLWSTHDHPINQWPPNQPTPGRPTPGQEPSDREPSKEHRP